MTRYLRRLAERLHIDLFPNAKVSGIRLLRELADQAERGAIDLKSVSVQHTDASPERKLEAVFIPTKTAE
jgi:hypothetical protein